MRMADEMKEPVKKTVERPAAKPVESKYSVAELTAASGVFKATPDVVKTALKLDGKDAYTLKEAERVVTAFGGKKIKLED